MTNIDPDKKVHGTSKVTAVPAKGGLPKWLPWLLAALGLLLLVLLFRGCGHHEAPRHHHQQHNDHHNDFPPPPPPPPRLM